MKQQINQMVHAMTSVMVMGMTFGMARPIMLQQGNGLPREFSDFRAWFKYGMTTTVYSLLSNDEIPVVVGRLRTSGRNAEADATVFVHNNTGATLMDFYDHFENMGITGRAQADIISMMLEHGSITLKEGR